MKVARVRDEEGARIPAPFERHIRWLFAPDRQGVNELTFVHVTLPPGGQTDYHKHDRPELIFVVSGHGVIRSGDEVVSITADMAVWVPAGEMHQVQNTSEEPVVLANVFVPGHTSARAYRERMEAVEKAR